MSPHGAGSARDEPEFHVWEAAPTEAEAATWPLL